MSKACCTVEDSHSNHHHQGPNHDHDHDHDHDHGDSSSLHTYIPAFISFLMLAIGMLSDHFQSPTIFQHESIRLIWYFVAYLPVGFPVFKQAVSLLKKGDFFNEFSLMSIATLGAFILGEYPEGVSVMLFYSLGELFQDAAVNRAKNNIKALLDVRPDQATVNRNSIWQITHPEEVNPGEIIQVKVGEKVPLDGILLSDSSSFNTAALTGESKPDTLRKGEMVLAGMMNLEKVIEIQTTKTYDDSSLARILHLVQEASSRKAKTELFIRKFAKVYTPIVFFLAVALVVLPYFIVENYQFNQWLYRALVFLVISCPCALVISIPLGYFGGIGAASRHGILFKGSNFLDLIGKINTVVLDKTGTLTHGIFEVQEIHSVHNQTDELLNYASALEVNSTHPIAKAIVAHSPNQWTATEVEEISGHGLKGKVNGKLVMAGNGKLLKKFKVDYPKEIDSIVESIVIIAIDNQYSGYITIADELKEDAQSAIRSLKQIGVKQTIMLSGDKESIVQKVAKEIQIDRAFGNLLPEDKVERLEELKKNPANQVAFVGDGINDAPVLALSDIGIAMGGMGSDAAIETADVVIQTDQPSKIATAIQIGRKTKEIVIQNITMAFAVKLIVLILGAGGLATLWEAVFADVGVALLAILNAIRIQRMKF